MSTLLENYKGKSDGSILTATEWNNCMSAIESGIEAAKSGIGSDDEGILYVDDGSTVLQSTTKNTNLVADKNVQIKSKKGKFIYDTTSTVREGGDNEIQIIAKVKDNINESNDGYKKEDHADEIHEIRRFRIKPFDTPRPTNRVETTEGFLAFDTSGLEETRGTSEEEFEIRTYSSNIKDSDVKLDNPEYRLLIIKSRGGDFRAMEAGGFAIQPCGFDHHSDPVFDPGHHFENKIKFESSRIKSITEGYHNDDSIEDKDAYVKNGKWVKGGKGLEFATFNNAHTSIFTKDYRFNEDGIVRAVTREKPIEFPTSGKIDYPTLSDDFKDVLSKDPHDNATVKSITKTAYSLNGGKDRHSKITSSGNIEIQTNKTYSWIETSAPTEDDVEISTISGTDSSFSDITKIYNEGDFKQLEHPYELGRVYKNSINNKYYKIKEIKSPELHLNSESDINLEASDDVILNAKDCVKLESPEIRMTGTNYISLNTTPKIVALTTKITSKGKQEGVDTLLVSGVLNNMNRTIYLNSSTGQINIPTDFTVFYTAADTEYVPSTSSSKTRVYSNSSATESPAEGIYFIKVGEDVYVVETGYDESKGGMCAKKEPKNCSDHITNPGYTNVNFVENDYEGEEGFVLLEPSSVSSSSESCSVSDLIKLVNWMKTNNQGPWA